MEYNKDQFRKTNDKKILHKVGKHWVSIGLSTLMAIGGVAVATQIDGASANSVGQNNTNHSTQSVNSADQHQHATLVANSIHNQNQSGSMDLGRLQHQANNLHTEIVNHSLQKTSSVNQGTQESSQNYGSASGSVSTSSNRSSQAHSASAASSAVSQAPLDSLTGASGSANKSSQSAGHASSAVDNAITVQYFNQHNLMVGSGTISGRSSGTSIDVINSQDGGIPIPNGYTLNNNQDPNGTFNNGKQDMQFGVTGKTVSGSINVEIVKKNMNGSLSSANKSVNVSGVVGNTVDIQPKYYVPAPISTDDYYYIDPGDHSVSLTVHPADAQHPTAYFTPNSIRYQYDESKKSPQSTGVIVVHYRNINTNGKINNINVRGGLNTPFNLKTYQDNVPQDYYYVKTAPYYAGMSIPDLFKSQTQDVIVYVKPLLYLRANLQFQDQSNHNNVVNTRILMSKSPNKPIDYQFLENNYTPKGYIPIGLGKNNDPVLKNGDTDVIYVKPGEDGIINVQYIYNHKVVGTVSDRKPLNSSFSISHYLDHAPVGYKPANQVISGQNVEKFTKVPQLVKIGVTPEDSTNKATVYITYRNINDPNNVIKKVSDSGTPGTTIDYSSYEKAPKLPSNYKFDYLDSAADHQFTDGDSENIFVKPIEKQGEATVYIDYRDVSDINHIIKTISDQGKPGSTIDYSEYEKSPKLPNGYTFVAPGSTDSTFSNNAHESLLVKKINTPHPQPKPSGKVTGTIIYQNDKDGSTVGQVPINGSDNAWIDYGKYTNSDSQYMPKGYQFAGFGPHGQYLEANARYYILVKPASAKLQKGTINVNYQDSSDHDKTVKNYNLHQPAGTQFNLSDYVNQIPDGYVFDKLSSGSNVHQFTDQTQDVDIIVSKQRKPVPQIHETLVYRNTKTQSDAGSLPLNGPQGTAINYANYIKVVPQGYTFAKLDPNDAQTLKSNGSYVIWVNPINHGHHSDQAPQINTQLIYRNVKTNSDVYKAPLSGPQGSRVNYDNYIKSVPNGYTFAQLAKGNTPTLQSNGRYIILVNPVVHQVSAKLIYRNAKTNSDAGTLPLNGPQGTSVDYDNYIKSVPSGYTFDRLANGNSSTLQNHGQYIVLVNPVIHDISTQVLYRNSKTGANVTSAPLSGQPGSPVDYSKYTNQIPQGYKLDQLASGNSKTLQKNGQYVILITPVSNRQSVSAKLIYQDAKTDSDVNTLPLNGSQGTSVNYDDYIKNVPSGYTFNRLANGDTSTLQNDGQYVILVNAVHHHSDQKPQVSAKLIYQDAKTNSDVSESPLNGQQGTQVDYVNYIENVPQGYTFAKLANGDTSTLQSNGQYVILVNSTQHHEQTPQVNTQLVYRNAKTNSDVYTVPLNGPQGTSVNYNHYIKGVPQGYTFARLANNNAQTLQNDGQYIILVNPVHHNQPVQQIHAQLVYQNAKTNSDVYAVPLNGPRGTSVDYNNYIKGIPQGYTFDRLAEGNASTLQDHGQYVILVNPVHHNESTPQISAQLVYQNAKTGSDVYTVPLNGPQGTSVNYNHYIKGVPQGYDFDRLANDNASTLQDHGQYVVLVNPAVNHHSDQPHQISTSLIYRNAATNSDVNTLPLNGQPGTIIDYANYIKSVPQGYVFDKLADGDAQTLQPNGNYIVMVTPNRHQVDDPLVYRDVATGQQVGSAHTISGTAGQLINFDQYDNNSSNMPQGYHLVSNPSNSILRSGQQYVITIAANHQPTPAQDSHIVVMYRNANDVNQIVAHHTLTEPVGTSFDLANYLNLIPTGYQFDGMMNDGNDVTKFTNADQMVNILVRANNTNHSNDNHDNNSGGKVTPVQKGTITVVYVTPDNHVISKYSDQRPVGTLFTSGDCLNWLPSGYQFDRVVSGDQVGQFTANPQNVVVQVSSTEPAPKPAPQPEPNSSSASSSSVTPAPAPAPSPSSSSNSVSSSNSQPNIPSSSSAPSSSSQPSNHSVSSSNVQPSNAGHRRRHGSAAAPRSNSVLKRPKSKVTNGHRRSANPGVRQKSSASVAGHNGRHVSHGAINQATSNAASYLANRINRNVASIGAASQNQSSSQNDNQDNNQNSRLPQTGEQANNRAMDIFAWLALASLVSLWGSATDRRHNR